MKYITKYYSIILSIILIVKTLVEYIDYRKFVIQNEKSDFPLDVIFGEWIVVISFTIVVLLELMIKKKLFKILLRILLTIILIGLFLKNIIPIKDSERGIGDTVVFMGIFATIFILILGFKKTVEKFKGKQLPK